MVKTIVIRRFLLCGLVFAFLATEPAIASVQYKIDSDVLAPLSAPRIRGSKVKIDRIPVDGKLESLELERFDLFTPDADIKVLGANDQVLARLAPPTTALYRGSIAGQRDSIVFLSVGSSRIQGLIFKDERRFAIDSRRRTHRQRTRDGEGIDVFVQESEPIDEVPLDGKGFTCDLEDALMSRKTARAAAIANFQPQSDGALATASARWVINMAIETDYELFVNVGSSTGNVTTFITDLFGAMSTIYNRELTTEVALSSLTINSSVSDPFTIVPGTAGTWNSLPYNCTSSSATTSPTACLSSLQALLEFGDRWHNSPPSAVAHSTAALISGKPQLAGVAWKDVLGQPDFFADPNDYPEPYKNHYGGSYSYNGGISPGNPPLVPNPDANAPTYTVPAGNYWPLLQVSHETGHNVFSGHTHCRALTGTDPATYGRAYVDNCYNLEGGCYGGTPAVPAEKGTIMSYCHLRSPNFATNSRFIFGKIGEASYVVPNDLKAALQNATPSLSAISAPATLAAGASGTASVNNVAGLTYLWTITNGAINTGQGTSSINFTANANPTTVRVKVTNTVSSSGPEGQTGCSVTDSKDIAVTSVSYDPPTGVVATATGATSVSISWSVPGGTTPAQYDIYRSSDGLTFSQIDFVTHPTTVYADNTASANTAYLYKVRSAGTGGTSESTDSNHDLATTVIFTDNPLIAGSTSVKATHITQLRTAVDAVRALTILGPGSYTDSSLTANVTSIKAAHINDLRSALDTARTALTLPALSYSETVNASATSIKTSHIEELRNGVK